MSEAVRDGWGISVASLLAGESQRLQGDVLDVGGGAELFARSLPDARLVSAADPIATADGLALERS